MQRKNKNRIIPMFMLNTDNAMLQIMPDIVYDDNIQQLYYFNVDYKLAIYDR